MHKIVRTIDKFLYVQAFWISKHTRYVLIGNNEEKTIASIGPFQVWHVTNQGYWLPILASQTSRHRSSLYWLAVTKKGQNFVNNGFSQI
jgi:hypothetical protein